MNGWRPHKPYRQITDQVDSDGSSRSVLVIRPAAWMGLLELHGF